MIAQKYILIVSVRKKPALFIKQILQTMLPENVSLITFSFAMDDRALLDRLLKKKPVFIIASGEHSYDCITKLVPSIDVLQAAREVSDPKFWDRLFLIPMHKEVLVVNETETGTMETIHSLQVLGINKLKYVPFWIGCPTDYSSIDTAISPGMLDICPESITHKIDIGKRMLSITFVLQVLERLGVSLKNVDRYVFTQKLLFNETCKRFSSEFQRAEKLKKSLQSIFARQNEALIGVNRQHGVTKFNLAAERLLGVPREQAVGKNLRALLNGACANLDSLLTEKDQSGKIIKIQDTLVCVSYMPVYWDDLTEGIFELKEVPELQKNEEQLKRISNKSRLEFTAKHTIQDIIHSCETMRDVMAMTRNIANTDSTILLTGESGTGKELFAQSIHNLSDRKHQPFIAVNIAALNDNLLESELFGYEQGAFTGAKSSGKKGLFELAQNGTLFLDEIGDCSNWAQSRLLRVLEEKEIMRLGDTKIIPIDVRVIAATNKNLKQHVEQGKFREDLYYRLNAFRIHIPALRKRKDDIPALVAHFMDIADMQKGFSPEAWKYILAYSWPGNIRELRNMVDFVRYRARGELIQASELPNDIISARQDEQQNAEKNSTPWILAGMNNPGLARHVLEIVGEHGEHGIGRRKVRETLEFQGIETTEAKVRTLLKRLYESGLIETGKTKQGSRITGKGKLVLLQSCEQFPAS